MAFCYTQISALLRHHQRSFLFKQTGTEAETSQWSKLQRVKDLGTLHPKRDVSIKPFPSELREPRRRGRKILRASGMEDTRETRLVNIAGLTYI